MTTKPTSAQAPSSPPPPGEAGAWLSISDLGHRTGVNPSTLRMWETRYGFPVPHRLPSGHRRYAESHVADVLQVLRRREAGVRLEVAIGEVSQSQVAPPTSVYAELRRRHPHLQPQRLRKATLIALSWALEDEACALAQRPLLLGAFQEAQHFRKAESRWRELSRTAAASYVLADFPDDPEVTPLPGGPVRVALPDDSPMRREWAVICHAPDHPVVLTAWEVPGQDHLPDLDRVFESLWSLEPLAVRDAAQTCLRVVGGLGHDVADVLEDLPEAPPTMSDELRAATSLFHRAMAYVDRIG